MVKVYVNKGDRHLEFELWIYAIKQLAQTYEMSQMIYNQLPQEEKNLLYLLVICLECTACMQKRKDGNLKF